MSMSLKSGDLIVAYEKGYHHFVKYDEMGRVHYTRAYNSNGKPCKGSKVLICSPAYCELCYEHLTKSIKQKQEELKALEWLRGIIE